MSADEEFVLRVRSLAAGRMELLAPALGIWVNAPERGVSLAAGDAAGALVVLGRARTLRVPEGAHGRVVQDPPALRSCPVEYGQSLILLEASDASTAAAPRKASAESAGMQLCALQAGRFWRGADPGAAPFLAEGEVMQAGRTFGLLEVMKTFQPLKYRAGAGLPPRARLIRWRVENGAEVAEGDALADLEST